ncbi:MAG TPA: hypothetical protein VMV93_14390, partial [Chloroflexota bacterium]|nr:hypothetical protein [Chloroflexota bacterium]
EASRLLKASIERALAELQRAPLRKTLKARYQKFRRMGQYNHYFNLAVAREVAHMQGWVQGLREHWPGRARPSAEGSPHLASPIAMGEGQANG